MKVEIVSFGYWIRRRRKALDLTQVALAHQVGCAAVTIKKIERDERRPSRVMAERLAVTLGIPPDESEQFIQTGLGEAPARDLPAPSEPLPMPLNYDFPKMGSKEENPCGDCFVGREAELTWLEGQMRLALEGKGRVIFIAGGAGRGKTALMEAFSKRVLAMDPDLLVSGGACNAFSGSGDPHLPFRDVMSYLSGDVEASWGAGTQNRENAQRVLRCVPTTLPTLLEHGPHLLKVFVSGSVLLSHAQRAAPGGAPWLANLQVEVNRVLKSEFTHSQSALYGQFTNVLRFLSNQHPLLITLDDLQWADEASLSLLFHLGRRLSGSRVLIIASYRPEDLAFELNGDQHPLETLIGEFKRKFGDVCINLGENDQVRGAEFVKAYLDSFPNRFGPDFYQTLHKRTGGHPLFTVELLREMQDRGDLVQDDEGYWTEESILDWDTLPARVEAVIAQRLERLDETQKHILRAASIEGEIFTVEVIAPVLKMEEPELIRVLSGQLARRHRLVRARGEIFNLAGLSPYQFSHALYQQYLLDQLDHGERRMLHGEVGKILEDLYQDQVEQIAARLAWHFQEAHQYQKAVDYLGMAGERAIQLSGYDEAVRLFQQGLVILDQLPKSGENAKMGLKIRLSLGEALNKSGNIDEALNSYQTAAEIAESVASPEDYALAALGYEDIRWRFNLPVETAMQLLHGALESLGPDESVLRVRLRTGLVRTSAYTTSAEQFYQMMEQAQAMAKRVGDPKALYEALYLKVWGDRRPGQSDARLAALDEMLLLSESFGDVERQEDIHGFRVLENLERGNMAAMKADHEMHRQLMEKMQQTFYTWAYHLFDSMLVILEGRFSEAEQLVQHVFNIGQQLAIGSVEGAYGIQMFTIRREQGRLQGLAPIVQMFIEQQVDNVVWRPGLALIYSELDDRDKALTIFEDLAGKNFEDIPKDSLWVTCIAYLTEVCAYLGDQERAAILYDLLLPYDGRAFVSGFSSVCFGAVSRFLGLLAASMARWETAECHFKDALEMNTRMGAKPWIAHTQYLYAVMLLARGKIEDRENAFTYLEEARETAKALEMQALLGKIRRIKR